jgi:hypothetical protein
MARDYARWATSPIGANLFIEDGGLTLASPGGASLSHFARSTIAHVGGTHGAEFVLWCEGYVLATLGVVTSAAPPVAEVGYANGIGWRTHTGEVLHNNIVVASGLPLPLLGEALGVRVVAGSPTVVQFFRGIIQVAEIETALAGGVHFAASLATEHADGLRCAVNAGQWQGLSPAVAAGWYASETTAEPMLLASEDYMTGSADTPANTPYLGALAGDGLATVASVSFWPWDNTSRSGTAQVRVLDAGGVLDAAALGALRNLPVRVRQVGQGAALATAIPVARYVLDRIDIEDDGTKQLVLRDAHDDLDEPLNRAVFLPPQGESIAWQAQPVIIGTVRSAPGISVNSDGSQQWLCDAPLASVGAVLDRGASLMAGTGYSLAVDGQQIVLTSPPVGPLVADVSTQPGMAPATLRQALGEVFGRVGKTAWSAPDADALDTTTGYAGIGFYAGGTATPRDALAAMLASYAADWWQDGEGVLRLAHMIDPDSVADADLAFDLDWTELAADLVVMPDLAPNLSRRMSYQPNATALTASDLITDLVQLRPTMRQQLTSEYRGQVYAGGALPARYARADTAAPVASRFDRREDAQAEIDRIIALYAVPRNFYAGRVTGRTDLQLRPGQIGRITYQRYGLAAGRQVLVTGVTSNRVTGEHTLKFWGA